MASFMGGLCFGAMTARHIISNKPATVPKAYKIAQFGIGGLQYPLAAHLLHLFRSKKGEGAAKSAGFLYALDVFGAALGALVTGVFLIPLYGIFAVAFLCVAINGAVFVLLYPARLSPDV